MGVFLAYFLLSTLLLTTFITFVIVLLVPALLVAIYLLALICLSPDDAFIPSPGEEGGSHHLRPAPRPPIQEEQQPQHRERGRYGESGAEEHQPLTQHTRLGHLQPGAAGVDGVRDLGDDNKAVFAGEDQVSLAVPSRAEA
ncbi:hypothetical protein AYL99_01416 [Fonsecaea erecta]|uniref:Uncharacterized protein n=1 Tax=Fonsecaea erecta TaxID=1367422 RepID=A0A178ZZY7_9EURO|nr:hypothetical protein AYL99_01416 [Fonsecaea erecta]OAP65444.1 hypothetical protein AYL99_01416 [Fonsecaea erecta]